MRIKKSLYFCSPSLRGKRGTSRGSPHCISILFTVWANIHIVSLIITNSQNAHKSYEEIWPNQKREYGLILQDLDRSGIRVRKQYLIQNFIVDFYIASRKLVIEIDGESHFTETGAIQDTSRTKVLEWEGITVIRFTNNRIMKEIDGVKIEILKYLSDIDTTHIEE